MQRVFVKDIGRTANGQPRFPSGTIRDYPKGIWTQIERNVGKPLETFTKSVEQIVKDASKVK